MNGYFGLTDFGWFDFLRSHPGWEEVNFWQPSGGTLLDPPAGAPFFLKLHATRGGSIVGFGHFSWRSRLPAWLAWDSFREANGASSRARFLEILAERRSMPVDPTGNFPIGCLLISRPVFLDEAEWVRAPLDWPRTGVQQGKYYDLDQGEGARVYQECMARSSGYAAAPLLAGGASPHGEQPERRTGSPYLVIPRLGQGGFRVAVTDVYGRACAITNEHSLPVLE